ncbi:PIG-L family deacetylase [Lutibacter sp. TH_r2]|uniref:PIG-L family deacetylase n=1 Tax=Lutibacter sp. TH_r2 TaxID=3082083 RepID=UPI0029540643|nr:PIG-L family deacetylase [Lutibacter sp. TH_r2]MDV7187265.1 PIG-L family deacetylase [Lutibacter sp. TH_r2]
MKSYFFAFVLALCCISISYSQKPKKLSSNQIYESIQKLNFLGSVLYVAAHPDDENTRMISYFANKVKAKTAYLSLTRGDGGQNLIGPEIRELLGVIRTQELLAARRIDGGEQFFTRANDFGYSKHPDETLEIWDEKEVLEDVVAIIRKYKPDVIINRFNHKTPGTTHGHHTSSAMLSFEAFDLVGDRNFKTHLKNDAVWQPKRLLFNTSWWFYGSRENFEKADKSKLLSVDIGKYYKQKGLSNSEIASLSRSQHQSQGFGSTGTRGEQIEYLEFLKGDFPKNNNVFDGIDTTWNRVEGASEIYKMLKEVEQEYNFRKPSVSIAKLVKAYSLITNLKNGYWKQIKLQEIKEIIAACSGLYMEASAIESNATLNSLVDFNVEVINRSDVEMKLTSIRIPSEKKEIAKDVYLENNKRFNKKSSIHISSEESFTSPYWLREKGSLGMYKVQNKGFIGNPETPKSLQVLFNVEIDGIKIPYYKNIIYKYNDPVKGEVYKPFEVLPEVSASFTEKVNIFSSDEAQKVQVKVKSLKDNFTGKLSVCLPNDWKVSPEKIDFTIAKKGEETTFEFMLTPPAKQSEGFISPMVEVGNKVYTSELVEIDYNHIPFQSVVMPSEAKVVRLNIEKKGQLIGYIQGAGDVVPTSLRQIGYTVVELKDDDVTEEKLVNFDAVVVGIRAYNTNNRIKFYNKHLLNYVENGGTLITQYNTSRRLKVNDIAPYKLKLSRDRVTDENSEVKILNPAHEIMSLPNKITDEDFKGWVQERGLYFPNEWSEEFVPILSMHDKNETPKKGSLLIANYGKGKYIYTGLSFFRELPAGVPGAYKLFANMLSVGKNKKENELKN